MIKQLCTFIAPSIDENIHYTITVTYTTQKTTFINISFTRLLESTYTYCPSYIAPCLKLCALREGSARPDRGGARHRRKGLELPIEYNFRHEVKRNNEVLGT